MLISDDMIYFVYFVWSYESYPPKKVAVSSKLLFSWANSQQFFA